MTLGGSTQRLYLGGDAYTAPAVYIKDGSSSWNIYYICRDYLGSITHTGTVVQELSYDVWGRFRNPVTQDIYELNSTPNLLLGRGFTGHEYLPWFGLINMNARLYDPVVGRFLSPDPYVAAPDFTQDYNRYTYTRNNPLMYVDPSGESLKSMWNDFKNWLRRIAPNGFEIGWNSNSGVFVRPTMNGAPYPYMNNPTVGYNQGFTFGNSANGFAQTTRVSNSYNPGQTVLQAEQRARNIYYESLGLGNQWNNTINDDMMNHLSMISGVIGVEGDALGLSNASFRLSNSQGFSPKLYTSGWRGNQYVSTYSISKLGKGVSAGANVVSTTFAYVDIFKGKGNTLTYADATVGTTALANSFAGYLGLSEVPLIGQVAMLYGWMRLWYDMGYYYGPSKWYGTDDTSWFK